MRLYELSESYRALSELAESGEDVSASLAELDGELVQKADQVAYVLRNLDAEAEAIGAELKRLTERRRALEANASRIKERALAAMVAAGATRLKAGALSIAVVECPPHVEVDEAAELPPEFTRVRVEPNKVALLAHFKATGEIVSGTRVERNQRLVIK